MTTLYEILRRPLITEGDQNAGKGCHRDDFRCKSGKREYYQYRGQTRPPRPQPPYDGAPRRLQESYRNPEGRANSPDL